MDCARRPRVPHVKELTLTMWDMNVTRAYEANRRGLTAAAARVCGEDQAADIAQDAFVRVWSNPDAFDETRGTLTRYLYVVTRACRLIVFERPSRNGHGTRTSMRVPRSRATSRRPR